MRVALLAALAFALAGCTSPPAPGSAPAPPARASVAANDAAGCTEAYVASLVPFEQARRSLPAGFTPRDGGDLFGSPAPTGMGLMGFGPYACAMADLGAGPDAILDVYVETPQGAPGARLPGEQDFYIPQWWTARPDFERILAGAGANITKADIALGVSPLPTGGGTGGARVADARGAGFTFDFTAATGPTFAAANYTFWAQTPGGLVIITYQVTGNLGDTGTATCTITDAHLAEAMGYATCPPGTLVTVNQGSRWVGKVAFYPGLRL